MKTSMKILVLGLLLTCLGSCSKEEPEFANLEDGEYLQFNTVVDKSQNSTVLYSNWVPTGFPETSLSGAEFFDLPLIKKSLFDSEKDLVIVYGKRNSVMPLPLTIPQDSESYMVELAPVEKGTIVRIRVAATNWATEALQTIFFRPSMNSKFRVVIVPGEKLFGF